ncbi:MAG TPA: TadE family protein [Lacipirellulaceae bacterium]|nr:TadE family protein [Lacipirellulaceae bacterium]
MGATPARRAGSRLGLTGHRPGNRTRAARAGAAAVEFAIVSPIFFMLVIGMMEVGRAIMVQQVLINASRAGARRATMLSSTSSAVVDTVTEYTASVGIPAVTTTVSPDPATAAAGTAITVNTSVSFANVSWLPRPWFMGGKVLSSSAVMRKEGF